MKAKSIQGKSAGDIQTALKELLADARPDDMPGQDNPNSDFSGNPVGRGFKPTIAFVFISIKQDRNAVCKILHDEDVDIIGATSSGEFIDGHQSEGEIAIMLLDIHKEDYCILFEDIKERTLNDAATHMTNAALKKFDKPAFILCSTLLSENGRMLDGETLIRSIEQIAGPQVNMFGGMAGDDISFTGTHVFTHEQSTDYGMVSLILNEDKISLYGMAISGWKPIGISRTATKTEGNLIYTIDQEPALDMYLRFLGQDKSSVDDRVNFFDSIGVHYPFQIERENLEPKMCNPIGYDKEKMALMCESDVPQGAKFRFSTPPDFDIVDTVVGKASALKNETHAEAEALLIFSCAGRLSALGPMAHEENEGIQKIWNVPMAGFYTYGEFGRTANGKHEFHSTTCCWVALKEK